MKAAIFLLVSAGFLVLAGHHAMAADCGGAIYTVQNPLNGKDLAYVDDRDYLEGDGTWIYLESNGKPGLQQGGTSVVPVVGSGLADPTGGTIGGLLWAPPADTYLYPPDEETCTDSDGPPDTLIF